MKVLIALDDVNGGGTEHAALQWIRLCHREEFDVAVCTLYGLGELEHNYAAVGCPVHFFDVKKVGYFKAARALKRLLWEQRPDAIVCVSGGTRALVPWLAKRAGVPARILYFANPKIMEDRRVHYFQRLQVMFATRFQACSREVAANIKELYAADPVDLILNGVDMRRFPVAEKSNHNGRVRILTIGSYRVAKNHEEKIRIAAHLESTGLDFVIQIAGNGTHRAAFEKHVAVAGLAHRFELLGWRPDIPELLQASDIFLHTSRYEGHCIAVLEGLASGTPCVLYDLAVLDEIDPERGAFAAVANGDAAAAAQAILRLTRDREEARRLSVCGRELVATRFPAEFSVRAWEDSLKRAVGAE